jgi:hypothetical protein
VGSCRSSEMSRSNERPFTGQRTSRPGGVGSGGPTEGSKSSERRECLWHDPAADLATQAGGDRQVFGDEQKQRAALYGPTYLDQGHGATAGEPAGWELGGRLVVDGYRIQRGGEGDSRSPAAAAETKKRERRA